MALQSGAFERLREFPSPGVLLRTLPLHVARGYSLRETAVRAKLAHWTDVSDVALLKRLRKSEDWLHSLCVELVRESGVNSVKRLPARGYGLWTARSSKSQAGRGASGGFYTACNCRI